MINQTEEHEVDGLVYAREIDELSQMVPSGDSRKPQVKDGSEPQTKSAGASGSTKPSSGKDHQQTAFADRDISKGVRDSKAEDADNPIPSSIHTVE